MLTAAELLANASTTTEWKYPPRGAYMKLFGDPLPEDMTSKVDVMTALRERAIQKLASMGFRVGDGGALVQVAPAEKAAAAAAEARLAAAKAARAGASEAAAATAPAKAPVAVEAPAKAPVAAEAPATEALVAPTKVTEAPAKAPPTADTAAARADAAAAKVAAKAKAPKATAPAKAAAKAPAKAAEAEAEADNGGSTSATGAKATASSASKARASPPKASAINPAFKWLGQRWQNSPARPKDGSGHHPYYIPPMTRMKAWAAELGHRCELQAHMPSFNDKFYYAYGSFPVWEDALAAMALVDPDERHFFELIPEGRAVKPYLDIDCDVLPAGYADVGALVARVQELATSVFREDLGVELKSEDFVWLESPKTEAGGKACSLHLVIATHGPQLAYRDALEAKHLAARLAPHFMAPAKEGVNGAKVPPKSYVDVVVYSKNHLMRLAGSSKFGKASKLQVFGSDGDTEVRRDSVITWLDDEAGGGDGGVKVIELSPHVLAQCEVAKAKPAVKKGKAKAKAKVGSAEDGGGSGAQPEGDGDGDYSDSDGESEDGSDASSVRSGATTYPEVSEEQVRAFAACLSEASAMCDYAKWTAIGFSLRREGILRRSPDMFWPDWHAFSAKAQFPKYRGEAACRAVWDGFVPSGKIKLGTLRHYAKEDDPEAYRVASLGATGATGAASHGESGAIVAARPSPPSELRARIVGKLQAACPGLFGALAPGTAALTREGNRIAFKAGASTYLIHLDNKMLPVTEHDSGEVVALLIPGDLLYEGPHNGLHPSIRAETNFRVKTPSLQKLLLESTNPADDSSIEYHRGKKSAHLSRPGLPPEELKTVKVKKMCAEIDGVQTAHSHATLGAELYTAIMQYKDCTVINVHAGDQLGADRAFGHVRNKMLAHASRNRYMKAGGNVYAPIDGSPCGYAKLCDFKRFVNDALKRDEVFHSNPNRFDEAMRYLNNFEVDEMPDFQRDRNIISFKNGVVMLSTAEFIPNYEIVDDHPLVNVVSRHHIPLDYTGSEATPLLDSILDVQFDPDVADVLCGLLGRLLFPIRGMDNMQIMPYLEGLAGTGKSTVLEIAQLMFRKDAIGILPRDREIVFGLQKLVNMEVVVGMDMQEHLSRSIPQEHMQSMVTGDGMNVANKGGDALFDHWTVPLAMASNHMPDYDNSKGNVSRRLATFRFTREVTAQNMSLVATVEGTELPAVVARCLRAYHRLRERATAAGGFWNCAPQKLREWQGDLGAATDKLQEYLAMDERERGLRIERVEGAMTHVIDLKKHFVEKMKLPWKAPDPAALRALGYRFEKGVKVCRSCLQIAKARGGKCCERYANDKRMPRDIIWDMQIATVFEPVATGGEGAEGEDEDEDEE